LTTTANSSPLDTPEIVTRTLDGTTSDTRDYKADLEDNQEENNDHDSLLGAPNPDTVIWPTEEVPSPPLDPSERIQRSIHKTPLPASLPSISTPTKPLVLRSPTALPSLLKSLQLPQPRKMNNNSAPGWFHGKSDKNAQNFLKEVDRYIVLNDLKNEAAKIVVFSMLLSSGSVADLWWTKLDSTKKTTWADVQITFNSRWPAITIAEKMSLDYQWEILALHIDEEELGTQITVAGVPTWAHLHFRVKLQQLISEAGQNETAGLVHQVRENLPMVIKELTTPGLADWTKFLEEIDTIDMNKL